MGKRNGGNAHSIHRGRCSSPALSPASRTVPGATEYHAVLALAKRSAAIAPNGAKRQAATATGGRANTATAEHNKIAATCLWYPRRMERPACVSGNPRGMVMVKKYRRGVR